ncbi:hypothetical protein Nepgr_031896 [Nepenthes gracilis]|uniref:Uncharacterized protein n=1 Tax=Nepenthes gracilis TaxID=150966 RepID=A0AAD3TJI1_NEPGR|nr:hypothetical protein Nepgr_031896 [Nepenthes gracilis]
MNVPQWMICHPHDTSPAMPQPSVPPKQLAAPSSLLFHLNAFLLAPQLGLSKLSPESIIDLKPNLGVGDPHHLTTVAH